MYWIRLFEGYEDNVWYENGGKEIVDKILNGEDDYGLKFFFSDPGDRSNEFEIGNDYVFLNTNISPKFSSYCDLTFNKIGYNIASVEIGLTPKKKTIFWSVCSPPDAEPLFRDIFSIEGSFSCPFILSSISCFSALAIIKDNGYLKSNEIKFLNDYSFDQIEEQYYLISHNELYSRRKYNGLELDFNLDTNIMNYMIPFSDLKWHDLKYRNCEQYVLQK